VVKRLAVHQSKHWLLSSLVGDECK